MQCRTVPAARLLSILAACAVAGCGYDPECTVESGGLQTIVLTFDDGPIAADEPDPAAHPHPDDLLDPLREILTVLNRRGHHAVFFIEGPGDDPGNALSTAHADGIVAIHDAGHRLGYHAWSHATDLWVQPLTPVSLASAQMAADLDRLTSWLDALCAARGRARDHVFAPLFRQPYGGAAVSRLAAWNAATQRGWTYRGFLIDSVDWLDNADSDPHLRMRLGVTSEGDYVAFVRERLRAGAASNAHRPVVDVLFHVNRFTAAHLDEWIDALKQAVAEQCACIPSFAVPQCYLNRDDPAVDVSVFEQLLTAR